MAGEEGAVVLTVFKSQYRLPTIIINKGITNISYSISIINNVVVLNLENYHGCRE